MEYGVECIRNERHDDEQQGIGDDDKKDIKQRSLPGPDDLQEFPVDDPNS